MLDFGVVPENSERLESLKVTNLKIPGFFFKNVYPPHSTLRPKIGPKIPYCS